MANNIYETTDTIYYVAHRRMGYIVSECYSLETARLEKEAFGVRFAIYDENGKEVK